MTIEETERLLAVLTRIADALEAQTSLSTKWHNEYMQWHDEQQALQKAVLAESMQKGSLMEERRRNHGTT